MSTFKKVLAGSMAYGAIAVVSLSAIGEPGLPGRLNSDSVVVQQLSYSSPLKLQTDLTQEHQSFL